MSHADLTPFTFNGTTYNLKAYPFMKPRSAEWTTDEGYKSIPPCLVLATPRVGSNDRSPDALDIWTLGFAQAYWRTDEFEYDVVLNGKPTGEFARAIECSAGKIRIYGKEGRRIWNGRQFI
jgi:hypothetical protein